jgi:hypothetical protein
MSSGFELPRLLAGRAMVKQILRWPAGEHVERGGCRSGSFFFFTCEVMEESHELCMQLL